ncbi:TPA: four helix bundle protein [Candidatus Campbellbacteria bacterium]|uniref:Four helix bundle protein n=2 Tax=Candidatus Campbelliibacteriota TaxID=1752727 RepID=A0A1F5EMG4_9BACT|nr:MAG: S23 ribosomal protein [Candidatus Campbellbacteria bacterium GW2011_OD1_34_28]KKP75295.1 MAG: S23 ribosomal protein [Candidatus Campbellbacteria bacterium GW2011_GWD2_35_24]KKP76144.1 MAG: S23 ribosomal protein [Candidatus Campbellbacteria bacterium GW2011_GWC2_35_28]KKP77333.1 MAG: S23 ribosomal protein [Candidatus Campbellbacteria bacterium GW2011_GWC1_35_31]KKP79262.1 MAG: S23 ribosomal protein [Candidatus Campbellbacteria bacterium GW2011_GWD1_35_49]OGD68426.1 MAG: four helix bundl
MKIERFEDIISWQKAEKLTLDIYNIFRNINDFGFKNQIQRSSVSIMNNIAEGFERKGNNELKYFLFVAKGSCAETRSMLHLSLQLKYLKEDQYKKLNELSIEISKLLSGLIKTL